MTYEEVKAAALVCSKYATAVEAKLYMDMKTDEAQAEIDLALRLSKVLNNFADKMDTVSPADLE